MILSDKDIEKQLDKGNIVITPFNKERLNANSYNLTLYNKILTYKDDVIDMKRNNTYNEHVLKPSGTILVPNTLYLARTNEYTETNGFVPMIEGRSSIGRLGMFVHVTAGFGDVGFKGYWTLEISVVKPLIIYPNVEICQIYYHTLSSKTKGKYNGKYQDNKGIQTSRLYLDFEWKNL